MTAHTKTFLTDSGTTHIYAQHSQALVSNHTFQAMQVGWSPIYVLTGLMIA